MTARAYAYVDRDLAVARRVVLARIALSPWSRQANDPDELERLDARAAALGVYVSTVKRTKAPAGWVVRVFDKGYVHVVTLRAQGPLAAIIAGALDDWEAAS